MNRPPLRWVLAVSVCCAFAQAIACGSEPSSDENVASDAADGGISQAKPTPASETSPARDSGPAAEPGAGGPPQVLFIGRMDTTDPAGPKATWPGTRIITRFYGTSVSVKLSEFAETWMDGAPSYWDVSIDHGPPRVIPMVADNQPHVFELASNLPAGPHEVELYKRSEMQTGITQFLGFDLHGGGGLPPPARQPRHIEAMADSYGTGYGITMLNAPNLDCPGADHGGQYQDFRQAYPSLIAARFNAELEGTVYSGKGLARGIWPTDTDGLIDYYKRSNPNPALQNNPPLFDLSSWIPDVILLVQGTVDHGGGEFRSVYHDFVVNQLRARAPKAHIFLVVPGRIGRDKWIDTIIRVTRERHEAGDMNVHHVIPGEEQPEEMTGCGYHGSPVYHQRIAKELGDVVAAKLGW